MKAITRINKIIETQECSMHDIDLLNKELHADELLPENLIVRFRPLFANFDILDKSTTYLVYHKVGKIENLISVLNRIITEGYSPLPKGQKGNEMKIYFNYNKDHEITEISFSNNGKISLITDKEAIRALSEITSAIKESSKPITITKNHYHF